MIPRPTFENEYLPAAYEGSAHPHQLACVFFAMALGVMFDLSRPPFHPRSRELFLLGRECLERMHEKASLATVQALVMVGTYVLNDNDGNGAESFWPLLGNAVKIALSVGLQRDGEAFGLDARDVDERRKVYWELMVRHNSTALTAGIRPHTGTELWPPVRPQQPARGHALPRRRRRVLCRRERVSPRQALSRQDARARRGHPGAADAGAVLGGCRPRRRAAGV